MKKARLYGKVLLMLALLLSTLQLDSKPAFATTGPIPLESVSQGSTVKFGGKDWIVLDPATRYLITPDLVDSRPFDGESKNVFDPEKANNLAYWLTYNFYQSLSNQDWIQEHDWTIGNEGDETSSTVTARVGLLSHNEWNTYKGMISSPFQDFYTRTPVGGYNYRVWVIACCLDPNLGYYHGGVNTNGSQGVRPTLYLQEGLFVLPDGEITIAADNQASTITATPAQVVADGTESSELTVTLKDRYGKALPNRTVSLAATGGSSTIVGTNPLTDANGRAFFTVTNTEIETVSYTATDELSNVALPPVSVIFKAIPADVAKSSVVASPTSLLADGSSQTTLTITVKDKNGNLLVGRPITLDQTGSSVITPIQATTDTIGQAIFSATNTEVETVSYTATDDIGNIALPSVSVAYEAGQVDEEESTLVASPTRVKADGRSQSILTVALKDKDGHPVIGHSVQLNQTGTSTITPSQATTDADGQAIFTVTNTKVQNVTYTATDMDEAVTIRESGLINFFTPYIPPTYYPVESVSLSPDSLTIQKGDPVVALQAAIRPSYASNQQVSWSSSDPSVAKVDASGTITPVSVGKAVITVTSVDGNKTATTIVTVEPSEEERVLVGLEVSDPTLVLMPNDSASFHVRAIYKDGTDADVTTNEKTSYKSSAKSIASVRAGEIKAGKKAGEANITIGYKGMTRQIKVTVSQAKVTRLLAFPKQALLTIDETRELTITAMLSDRKKVDVSSKAEWTSNDPQIASVKNGKLTANGIGKTKMTASYGGKTTSFEVSVVEEKPVKKLVSSKRIWKLAQEERIELSVRAVYADGYEEDVTDRATWTISDETIATVDNGELTGLSRGQTSVSAKYNGQVVRMTVYVLEKKE